MHSLPGGLPGDDTTSGSGCPGRSIQVDLNIVVFLLSFIKLSPSVYGQRF